MSRICWHSQIETIKKIYWLRHLSQYLIQCGEARIETWHISVLVSRRQPWLPSQSKRNKYESSKVTVYIKNKGTALDVTAQSDKPCNPPDQKKKKIRTLRRCTKGISFQTSKSIQRQNQKQKLWFFKSDLHKSVLCLFPFSFTV